MQPGFLSLLRDEAALCVYEYPVKHAVPARYDVVVIRLASRADDLIAWHAQQQDDGLHVFEQRSVLRGR